MPLLMLSTIDWFLSHTTTKAPLLAKVQARGSPILPPPTTTIRSAALFILLSRFCARALQSNLLLQRPVGQRRANTLDRTLCNHQTVIECRLRRLQHAHDPGASASGKDRVLLAFYGAMKLFDHSNKGFTIWYAW